MSRKEQKEQTRLTLMESARSVLAHKGIDGTQISDITQAAGVAHGTFYVHFKNKEALITTLVDTFNARLRSEIIGRLQSPRVGQLKKILTDVAGIFLDRIREERELIAAIGMRYGDSLPLAWISNGVNPPMVAYVIHLLENLGPSEGRPGGKAADYDPEILTHAILAMWARIGFRYALADRIKRDGTIGMLVELTLGALSPFLPGVL
jgi:AcrR family transcriptional regulator